MGLFVQHFCALKEFIARERWSFSAQVFRQPRHEGKNSNTLTVTEYNVVEKSLSFKNARVRNFPRSSCSKVKADPRTASRV